MPARIGKQTVVVGAGMAGLTAARALVDSFDRVIILENDALPQEQRTDQARRNQGTCMVCLQAACKP